MAAATYALTHSPADFVFIAALGAAALFLYQIDRGLGFSPEDDVNNPLRVQWMLSHRRYVYASVVLSGAVSLLLLLKLSGIPLLLAASVGLVGVLHALPGIGTLPRLKSSGILKAVLITTGWLFGCVLLPIILSENVDLQTATLLVVYRAPLVLLCQQVADLIDTPGDCTSSGQSRRLTASHRSVQGLTVSLVLLASISGAIYTWMTGLHLLMAIDMIALFVIGIHAWQSRPHDAVSSTILDAMLAGTWVTWVAAQLLV